MIYVPEFNNNTCCFVNDSNTIRCYDQRPVPNSTIGYTDYFVNSHYLSRTGMQTFSNYSTFNYDCISTSNLTKAYLYRNDSVDIILLFILLVSVIFGLFGFAWKSFRRGLFY